MAEQDHHATRLQAIDALHEGGVAHAVVDHLDALAAGQALDLSHHVLLAVQDHLVGAGLARDLGLLASARGADDPPATHFYHLRNQASGAARGGVHQRGLACSDGECRMREIVRCHALQHGRGGLPQIEAIGHLHQEMRGNGRVFGITAARHGPRDRIAHTQPGDAFAQRFHDARALHAEHERQRNFVQPGALIRVNEVHAGGRHLHQRLAGRRHGLGEVGIPQDVGAAVLFDKNCFHDVLILRLVCTTAA